MSAKSTDGLRAYRAGVSASKRESVLAALETLAERTGTISVAELARVARVSREFIHSHEELHRRVQLLNLRQTEAALQLQSESASLSAGRDADKSTLMTKVLQQRATIDALGARVKQLESGRARRLGEQLLVLDGSPQLEALELSTSLERLRSEYDQLRFDFGEATLLVSRLQDDLRGVRQALAEALTDVRAHSETAFMDRVQRGRTEEEIPP